MKIIRDFSRAIYRSLSFRSARHGPLFPRICRSGQSQAFIASSSYIYIDGFGLSEKLYSLYLAFNALGMIGRPMLYLRLSHRFARRSIIMAGFACIFAGGLLVYLFGSLQPRLFAICLFPATISFGLWLLLSSRPFVNQIPEARFKTG